MQNVELPPLPHRAAEAIVAGNKPVVIKRDIFAKIKKRHKDLSPEQSRSILSEALYRLVWAKPKDDKTFQLDFDTQWRQVFFCRIGG